MAQYCKDTDILLYFTVNKAASRPEEAKNVVDTELDYDQLSEIFIKSKTLKSKDIRLEIHIILWII